MTADVSLVEGGHEPRYGTTPRAAKYSDVTATTWS
jgi:hypothetical protein